MSPTFVDPLAAASEAIYGVLQDAAFLALCPGGVVDSIPQTPTYPLLLYTVTNAKQYGGLGTKPGVHTLPEIAIRFHAYSQFGGMRECHTIIAAAINLLKDPPATVTGYSSWAIFWDSETPLPNEVLIGVTVQELVAQGRLYIEES